MILTHFCLFSMIVLDSKRYNYAYDLLCIIMNSSLIFELHHGYHHAHMMTKTY